MDRDCASGQAIKVKSRQWYPLIVVDHGQSVAPTIAMLHLDLDDEIRSLWGLAGMGTVQYRRDNSIEASSNFWLYQVAVPLRVCFDERSFFSLVGGWMVLPAVQTRPPPISLSYCQCWPGFFNPLPRRTCFFPRPQQLGIALVGFSLATLAFFGLTSLTVELTICPTSVELSESLRL